MEEKKYRPNVAGVVLSSAYPFACEVLIGHRSDMRDAWQFPQGGIDEGEDPKTALLRELKEEIGTDNVEILAGFPHWLSYDFPHPSDRFKGYDGQKQRYFLVRLKNNADIDIAREKTPEFDSYKFVNVRDVLNHTNHFKRGIYAQVLKYFKQEGYI